MSSRTTLPSFAIELPGDWEDQTAYTFKGPEDSGIQHMLALIIDRHAGDVELADYARERIDMLLDTMQGMEILKEEQITLASGLAAYEVVIKWVPNDENIIFRKQVFALHDGTGYTFSINFSKKTMKTIGVEVSRMIDSFIPEGVVPGEDE